MENQKNTRATLGAFVAKLTSGTADRADLLALDLRALELRAADLAPQAADAQRAAKTAQAALIDGTGSADAVASAQAQANALNEALRVVNGQAQSKRAELSAERENEARRQIELQAVETARRAAIHARELAQLADEANAALERFAALANTAKAEYEREQNSYVAQVKDLTAADELTNVHYALELNATFARLEAQGAPDTNAPNLRALRFGPLLLQAMAQGAPASVFVPTWGAPPPDVPQPDAKAPAAPPSAFTSASVVPWPSRS